MNRLIASIVAVVVLSVGAVARPPVVILSTDPNGIAYRIDYSAPMSRDALVEWFAKSKPDWEVIPVRVRVEPGTALSSVVLLLAQLKERAGVQHFELEVVLEGKAGHNGFVTQTVHLTSEQITPPERLLLSPSQYSPEAVLDRVSPPPTGQSAVPSK